MEFVVILVVLLVLGVLTRRALPRGRRAGDPVVDERPPGRD